MDNFHNCRPTMPRLQQTMRPVGQPANPTRPGIAAPERTRAAYGADIAAGAVHPRAALLGRQGPPQHAPAHGYRGTEPEQQQRPTALPQNAGLGIGTTQRTARTHPTPSPPPSSSPPSRTDGAEREAAALRPRAPGRPQRHTGPHSRRLQPKNRPRAGTPAVDEF